MTKDEFELMLFDRIEIIKTANKKYNLEENAYISFSGGKDSTILHYLIDKAIPNNSIPRVYIDTGVEYQEIRNFVKNLAANDKRFIFINPSKPVKQILERFGYPFKSKQHSHDLSIYQKSGMTKTVKKYLRLQAGNNLIACPKSLLYQFSPNFDIKISDICCKKLKKEPAIKWQKQNNKNIVLTGMRKEEGGQRKGIKGCIITDKDGNMKKFHPLLVVSEDFENEFINQNNIELCKLYYNPYNFKRTGCAGCPFSLELQAQLDVMEKYLPNQKKQCEFLWSPVYNEYRRLGYRLRKHGELKQFNLFEDDML